MNDTRETVEPTLSVRGLEVRFGDRTVLTGVDFEVLPRTVFVLMGPGGAGKSTLVRAVTGSLESDAVEISGTSTYRGSSKHPGFVRQNPGRAMESVYEFLASAHPRRSEWTRPEFRDRLEAYLVECGAEWLTDHLSDRVVDQDSSTLALLRVVRATLERRDLICLDEPASSLGADETSTLTEFIERESERRSFLLVTHNQQRAREVADRIGFLAGGRLVEDRDAAAFFRDPRTRPAQQFLETGSCSVTSPNLAMRPNGGAHGSVPDEPPPERSSGPSDSGETEPAEGEDRDRPRITYRHPSEVRGPEGFRWLIGGRLGSSPIPGAMAPVEHDLQALERIGVTLLITLTEHSLANEHLEEVGFENFHFPIVDMEAPEIEPTVELCDRVGRWLTNGASVVFHCRAGMGRAGTMLCAMLVWDGHTADCALQWARSVYDRWVQSAEQEQFLEQLEDWLAERQPDRQDRMFSDDLALRCRCS